MTQNSLLQADKLPLFSQIKVEDIEPAIDEILKNNRQLIEKLLQQSEFTWENLITPLEEAEHCLDETWAPIRHLNSVMNQQELRQAHDNCVEKISAYYSELGQNQALFKAYESLAKGSEYSQYSTAQKKILEYALRDFRLAGVALEAEKKQRFLDIQKKLSKLHSTYGNNLLDATDAWSINVTDANQIAGIPQHAEAAAKQLAEKNQQQGWTFNLEFPSYIAVLTYCDDQSLRETLYYAYNTRASDQGPHAGQWDNGPIIEDIMALRHEEAQLLQFKQYADLSLATKMAKSTKEVMSFLQDLAQRSVHHAKNDYQELCTYAKEEHGVTQLQPWDIPYYSEKLKQQRYAISKKELRPYFPENKVVPGLFTVVKRLFGMSIKPVTDFNSWHPDVKFFEVYDEKDNLRGKVYMDLYARPGKKSGAWMDQCRDRYIDNNGDVNTPVAFLVCNFSAPTQGEPALLDHDQVITLFHEFGHVLQGILTLVNYSEVAGINNVAWDDVEVPSQFLENWCWDKEALSLISGHVESGKPIPDALYKKMIAAKNFQSAMFMVRQLEFALFDFRLHTEYDPNKGARAQEIIDDVRQQVAVYQVPAYNRFQTSFSHIFAGGYAAGYYSYKWAEVLSSDAFSKFEEKGVFDETTGHEFLTSILEVGSTVDPTEAFINFRGREPRIEALLRHSGLD